ncbi:MAG: 4Fe-4S binding protein, partial [Candidatus Thermoplasmatota archaeon]|nr:4Fe-4S binding protein [Candidatus Thermoplasmatota archaeon]
IFRRVFLPNASCRYINSAPTSCFYYQLQDGLTQGSYNYFVDVLIMLLVVIILIIVLGRIWCSWLCPFGMVQEFMGWLREKIGISQIRLKWSHRVLLRRVKYAIIFLTVIISVPIGISSLGLVGSQSTFALPFCQVCPAKGFFTMSQQILGLEPWTTTLPVLAIISLVLFLGTSFFLNMAFCRICPMGGFMALFSKLSLFWLRKDPDKCTECKVCLRVCPLDHDKVYEDMESDDVSGQDCTLCGKCVEMCPEKDCLSLMFGPFKLAGSKRPRDLGIPFIGRFLKGSRIGGDKK